MLERMRVHAALTRTSCRRSRCSVSWAAGPTRPRKIGPKGHPAKRRSREAHQGKRGGPQAPEAERRVGGQDRERRGQRLEARQRRRRPATSLPTARSTGPKVDESTLGIVPNADLIDGVDSGDLMRGAGRARAASGTATPSAVHPRQSSTSSTASSRSNAENPALGRLRFRLHEHERRDRKRLDRQGPGRLRDRTPDLRPRRPANRGERDGVRVRSECLGRQKLRQVHDRHRRRGSR